MGPCLQSVRKYLLRLGFKAYNKKTRLGVVLDGPKRSEVKAGRPACVTITFGEGHSVGEVERALYALRERYSVPSGYADRQRRIVVYARQRREDEFEAPDDTMSF